MRLGIFAAIMGAFLGFWVACFVASGLYPLSPTREQLTIFMSAGAIAGAIVGLADTVGEVARAIRQSTPALRHIAATIRESGTPEPDEENSSD